MGEQFGNYEIEKRIGAGGMAEVFLAARRGPEGFRKRVALKRVLPAYNDDAEFVRLFQDEARLAAQLNHQHIASIHDFGAVDGTWFMVMEYVEGCDLRSLITGLKRLEQPMPTDLVLLIAADLASALAYAHELELEGTPVRLVHRDVSPSNVLLSQDGAVKLADFGIARAATQGHHTRTGVVKGKVPYMPPEQALGQAIDHRVDLFALGVVLFECLSGRRPYEGVTELDTLQRVSKGQHPPICEVAPHTPPLLAEVVERLIRPNAKDRYSCASDVLDALATTPPPTNARRMLGHMVRRVQEAFPPTISQARSAPAFRSQTFAPPQSTPTPAPVVDAPTRVSRAVEAAPTSSTPPGRKKNDVVLHLPSPPKLPSPGPSLEFSAPKTVIVPRPTVPPRPTDAAGSASSTTSVPGFSVWTPGAWPVSLRVLVGLAVALAMTLSAAVVGGAIVNSLSASQTPVAVTTPVAATAPAAIRDSPVPVEAPLAVRNPTSTPPARSLVEPTADDDESTAAPSTETRPSGDEPPRERRPRSRETGTRTDRDPPRSSTAAATSASRGTLRVVAYPMGRVVIDGRDHGTSPVSVRLPPGDHSVVVDDYQGHSQTHGATVTSGRTEELVVRFR